MRVTPNFSHRVIQLEDCKRSHTNEWYKKYIGVHGMLEAMRRCIIDVDVKGMIDKDKVAKRDLKFSTQEYSWFPVFYNTAKYNNGNSNKVVRHFQIFIALYGCRLFTNLSKYIYDAAFPNRKVPFHKKFRTETVKGIAWTIYGGERFDLMPILADALEEAGFDFAPLLDRLRTGECFTRASWVLARITQTERY